jgi:hypothetical protein
VQRRDGDEAGIAEDVEQNFHPDRHDIAPPGKKFRKAGLVPARAMKNPTGIRRHRRGFHALTPSEAAALDQ